MVDKAYNIAMQLIKDSLQLGHLGISKDDKTIECMRREIWESRDMSTSEKAQALRKLS